MVQELQQIFSNPLWTWVFFSIAIVLAIVLYIKGKKAKKPRYYIKSHNLVTDFTSKLDKLKLLYGNTSIMNLTVSKVGFWNEGELIESKDILEEDPLRIESIGECEILNATVIKEINKLNNFRINLVNGKSVTILFNFLDKGQGGAIQVIHTGKGTSDIKVDGYVKGIGKPRPSYTRGRIATILDRVLNPSAQNKPTKPSPVRERRVNAIALLFMALVVLMMGFSSGSIPSMAFFSLIFLLLVVYSYRLYKRRVPKGLGIVEEEDF